MNTARTPTARFPSTGRLTPSKYRAAAATKLEDTQWITRRNRLDGICSQMRKVPDPPSIAEAALLFAWLCIDPAAWTGSDILTVWKETMRSFHVCRQMVTTTLMAFGIGLALIPAASADPAGADQPQPPALVPGEAPPDVPGAIPESAAVPGAPIGPSGTPQGVDPQTAQMPSSGDPTKDACDLFNKASNYAAINYEDFADYSAGSGNYVNYQDQTVENANTAGRTALRQAAAAALSASGVPGAAPEVTAPMRNWSLSAAKLVLIMGVRGGGDTLNSTANDLNRQAKEAQMACATAQMTS